MAEKQYMLFPILGVKKYKGKTTAVKNTTKIKLNKIKDLRPHFEWYPISYSDLFESKKLTFVFHIEGQEKEKCADILLQKANADSIDYLKKYTSNTYYKKEYKLPKPFASMNDDEQREFLKSVYSSEEVKKIIELMNGTIAEMKK
jgi:hypothetical protein